MTMCRLVVYSYVCVCVCVDMSIGQILNAETPAPTKEEEEFSKWQFQFQLRIACMLTCGLLCVCYIALQFMADDFVDGLDKEFDSKAFIDNNGYTNTPQSSVKPSVPDDDVVEIEPVAPLIKPAASPIIINLPITPPRPSTGSLSVNVPPPAPRVLPPNISLKCPVTNKPIIEKKESEESGDEYVTESSSSESSDDEDFAIPVRTPPSPKAPKYHYTSTKITACNYPPPTPQSVVSAATKKRTREDDDDEVEWEPIALTPPKKLKAVKAKSDPSIVKQRDTSKFKCVSMSCIRWCADVLYVFMFCSLHHLCQL